MRLKSTVLLLLAAALVLLFPLSCSRAGSSETEAAEKPSISFLPSGDDRVESGKGGGKQDQFPDADKGAGTQPHALFYLNGVWSAVGAYDDDLFYDYDEIDEMSLVFENGWVAFTAGGETQICAVSQEDGMVFFTVAGVEETDPARIVIDYYDNGYYLGLVPENDPGFQILFERQ